MKRYEFKLIIYEGCDEFWEDISKRKVTGCIEVYSEIKSALENSGFFFDQDDNNGLFLSQYNENEKCV